MCSICDGGSWDEVRQRLSDYIDWYGWGFQGVEATAERWGWTYTIGLSERFGHPELVVVSRLSFEANATLLNIVGDEIQLGRRFVAGEKVTLAETDLSFAAVHPRQFGHGVFNMWFDHYRAFPEWISGLTALQVVLPPEFFCMHTGPQPRLDRPQEALRVRGATRAERRARAREPRRRPPPSGHG